MSRTLWCHRAFRSKANDPSQAPDVPTPAIAGEPCEAALQWIADHENLDRGWYGGPVGFVDTAGGGEFYAALRSSLVAGDQARLFAGAGIVHGSEPERELRETRLKLRTMLAPLFDI